MVCDFEWFGFDCVSDIGGCELGWFGWGDVGVVELGSGYFGDLDGCCCVFEYWILGCFGGCN